MTPTRFAVVLTHDRPELLRRCVEAIAPQVDRVIVIDNASNPPVSRSLFDGMSSAHLEGLLVANVPTQPPNIPHLWRIGLIAVEAMRTATAQEYPYHVAFLCDDAMAPAGWFETVSGAMRATGAVAGCSDPFGREHDPILKTLPDSDLMHRMVGWAFILDPSADVVPDESMPWWWCDTDIDWQARKAGGMVMVGAANLIVPNERPGEFTTTVPGLGQQAGDDGLTFAAKWGGRPW